MARLIRKAKQYGFTLVELLIVVAIIGVLSTVGIPSFRRMVQKSKKSEAKVNLGGIYTAEQAFFSEYGAFGNSLGNIGFIADGQPLTFYYNIGFFGGQCQTNLAIMPTKASTVGQSINATFPAYYTGAHNTRVGYPCTTANFGTAPTVLTVYGAPRADVYDTGGGVPDRFLAVATGVIAPGVDKLVQPAGKTDIWAIDHQRVLKNTHDGVQ